MKKILTIQVSIPRRALLITLIEEFYRLAGKAGANYGKSPEHDPDEIEEMENPRDYWLGVTVDLHQAIEQIERCLANEEPVLRLVFDHNDFEFLDFLKTELAAMSARLSKKAWEEYSPALRQGILEESPLVVARMRDQVCEFTQPRLFKDEAQVKVFHLEAA